MHEFCIAEINNISCQLALSNVNTLVGAELVTGLFFQFVLIKVVTFLRDVSGFSGGVESINDDQYFQMRDFT